MQFQRLILSLVALTITFTAFGESPERALMAKQQGKSLTVKEWKTTPDGKNKWIDHTETYNSLGQLIAEAEYADFGRHLAWKAEFEYKVRKYEDDSNGVCIRRLNYNANGTLNSYRQFEYTFE